MNYDWTPLRKALATSRAQRVSVPLWWRDDDAIIATRALDHLTDLSRRTGIPVHLAIIPAHVDPALPDLLDPDYMLPIVHGWAHTDHSRPDEKKNEFLTVRAHSVQETRLAMEKLTGLFGPRLRRMFVPPWNRINPAVTAALAGQGYQCLSTFGARHAASLSGLSLVNTHVDPIWWNGSRDLLDPDALITRAATHIEARAQGLADADEPFGLLTHHLVHSPAIWAFAEAFLTEMQTGGASRWTMENKV
jgi:hypothetical protein